MTFTPLPEPVHAALPRPSGGGVLARLMRRKLALFGIVVIALVAAIAAAAPLIAPYDPAEQIFDGLTLEGAPLPPNSAFLLGTDLLGRDLLSRLIYGARTSLVIGVVANGAAAAIAATSRMMATPNSASFRRMSRASTPPPAGRGRAGCTGSGRGVYVMAGAPAVMPMLDLVHAGLAGDQAGRDECLARRKGGGIVAALPHVSANRTIPAGGGRQILARA